MLKYTLWILQWLLSSLTLVLSWRRFRNVPCVWISPFVARHTEYSSNQPRSCDDDTLVKPFYWCRSFRKNCGMKSNNLAYRRRMYLNNLFIKTQPPIMLSEADCSQEGPVVRTSLTDTYNIGATTCIAWPRPALHLRSLVMVKVWIECKAMRGEEVGSNCSPDRSSSPRLSWGSTVQLACR